MKLSIIGSNSAGNCYILENDTEALIIECGVKMNRIKQALGFNLSKVVGCIVTHEHKDHCCAVMDMLSAGIQVYATAGTHGAMKSIKHHNAQLIAPGHVGYKKFQVGGFSVLAFAVKHDATEPVGFLINHPDTGNVLFLTDSYYCEYTFKDLNNIIVEANYSQEILDRRLQGGESPDFLRNRVLASHMSLDTCKNLLRANDLSKVNNIVLIHLSDSNSDAKLFHKEVLELTGKTVHVAQAGMTIKNFTTSPF